jgi:hypothetical protein
VKAIGWLASRIPFLVLGFVGAEVFHKFKLIKVEQKVTIGELLGFFLSLFLAYLVSSRWKTLQFGKESTKKLILDLTKEFRGVFTVIKTNAEFLAVKGYDDEKFQ